MSLKTQLITEMKQAMKASDKVRLGTIRFLLAEIKNYEIDHGEQDDAGILKIVARQVKQIKESLTEYQKGGRADLVAEEEKKLAVLTEYLPTQLSDAELTDIIHQQIAQSDQPQPGPIVGRVMAQVQGRAEGSRVAQLVNQVLQK